MSRIESCFRKLESIDRRAIESNDGRPSVPSVRASCNYFDPWTWFVRCQSNLFMGLQRDIGRESRSGRIHLFLDRRFHPGWPTVSTRFCPLFPGTRIRFHGREIFSLDFGRGTASK